MSALGLRETDYLLALIHTLDDRRSTSQDESPRALALWGWSLGAGVSIDAAGCDALRDRVIAVIAEAPYRLPQTPARNVLALWGLPHGWSLSFALFVLGLRHRCRLWTREHGPFDRATRARSVAAPLLVLHGDQDDVCPVEDGRTIARAAPHGTIEILEGCGHHGIWTTSDSRASADQAVRAFLGRVLRGAPGE
jgi:pimeloyl-ACP methyl ester carboxylesterase